MLKNITKTLIKTGSSSLKLRLQCYTTESVKTRRKEIMTKGLPKVKPIDGVKEIILVSSGKGGVGKSTIAVNLSTALKLENPEKNVGLLDTDIFGPSIPLMMNLHETPFLTDKNLMEPLQNYGVKCMSMGFLIEEGSPVIWRGLMVMQALEKLMRQVDWGEIDYLIIDTPPGTGDTHLSLVQNLPISGTILVTTPQTASLQVTKRGANMFKKLNIPIIGIIENMSKVICPSCSTDIRIFGDGTTELAKELDIKILEKLALNVDISQSTDVGVPIVLNKNSPENIYYKNITRQVIQFLEEQNK